MAVILWEENMRTLSDTESASQHVDAAIRRLLWATNDLEPGNPMLALVTDLLAIKERIAAL